MTQEHRPFIPPQAQEQAALQPEPGAASEPHPGAQPLEQPRTYEKSKTITLHAYYIDKPEVEKIYHAPNRQTGQEDIYHKFLVAIREPGEETRWLTVVERGEKALKRWAKNDIQHNQEIELIGRLQKREKKSHQQFWAFLVKPVEKETTE